MPKKTTLQFKEGTSDKTYEIWLEATPSGKSYKVNFAYGRTGGNLKTGTKTPRAVALEKAEEIFEKLVAEKKKKGYKAKRGKAPAKKKAVKKTVKKVAKMKLIEAIKEGDIEVVKKAIADGEDVNAKDDDGGTPLDAAVYEGRAVVVHLLIAAGADVNAKNDNGQTPLHAADNKEIAELLIAAGADVNDGLLFSHVDRPHSETIIELLIKNGADVNAKEEDVTPLHIAVNVGRREIAELLIAAGADVNVKDGDGETPLDLTATFPGEPAYDETAELLLEHGGKTGEELAELRNIIIGAVEEGNIEAVKQHLDAGTDVNAKDYDDFGLTTLLHRASMMGHKEVAGLLITKGADVNAKDAVWDESVVGETPLDCAIEKNHTEIADLLRKHGGKTGGELKAEGK